MEFAKALCLISILAMHWRLSAGDAQLSIRFNSYDNPKGKGDNGNCCDGIGSLCRGKCDHYFHVCVDQPSSTNNDIFTCPLGKNTTGSIQEANKIPSFGSTIGGTPNPIVVDIAGAWEGGVLLRIDVMDLDGRNTNDLVEQLKYKLMTDPNGERHDVRPTNRYRSKTRTTLSLTLEVECKDGFYGPRCDCQEGPNYDCDHDTGEKLCHDGWAGPNCDQEVNECDSQPCQNGATCFNEDGYFRCECATGYAGDNCERDVDGCADAPCHALATCESPPGVLFDCICPPNLTGQRCETSVHMPCDDDPCENSGVCEDEGTSSYTCSCQGGWTGTDCETELDECASNPCGANQECHDLLDGYDCYCVDGWEGANCDVNIDDCVNNQCEQGSTCVDDVLGYSCVCPVGVKGTYCDETRCGDVICLNGASCHEDPAAGGEQCACTEDYVGTDCSVFRKCEEEPCLNNGTCADEPTNERWCFCDWHHYGKSCENEIEDCPHKYTAEDKLMCDHAQMNDSTELSLCWPADEGDTGKQKMDQLCYVDEPCQCHHGGTCYKTGDDLSCVCPKDYKGPHCDVEVGTGPSFIFESKLADDEIKAFVDTIHESTASVLAKNKSDIAVFHDVFICEENKKRYTVIVADIFEGSKLINEDCETAVFDDVRQEVQADSNYTDSDSFEIGKLDHENCVLSDPKSWAARPKLFGLIVGVCVVTVVLVVFSFIIWKSQRPSPAYNIQPTQFATTT